MDDERFILEVEKHSILYNTSDPFYKDNTRKEKAWNLIGEVLGVGADICKARWKSLRDAFVKNKKKYMPSGSAGGGQKDWKYAEIMSFLLPHIQPRSSKSNLLPPPSGDVEDVARSVTPRSDDSRSSTPTVQQRSTSVTGSPTPSSSRPTTSGEKEPRPSRSRSPRDRRSRTAAPQQAPRRSSQTTSDIGERLISILQEPTPKPHMPEEELDECYHFALSLVPMLHRLDKDRRQEAKIKILSTLHTLERSASQQPQHTLPQQQVSGWQPIHPPPPPTPRPAPTQEITGHSSHTSRLGGFQPTPPPPQSMPSSMGPFTQMLSSSYDPQWEQGSTGRYYEEL